MFFVIIILMLLQRLTFVSCNRQTFVMIRDYVVQQNDSTMVVGYFCKETDAVKFATLLKEINIQTSSYVNILNPTYLTPPNNVMYVVDANCATGLTVLRNANEALFATPFRWLILVKYLESLPNINMLVGSRVTLALEVEESYNFLTVYKLQRNSMVTYEKEGRWHKSIGYVHNKLDPALASRRKNLQGIVINTCIVITNNNSLLHLLDKRDKHIDTIAKVNYVFMIHLMDILNVTMNFSIENSWGYKDKNGNWSGMIGELTRSKAEIGGTPLFLTSDRVAIIDYIAMTTPTKSKFVFRRPKLSYVTNIFTLPFHDDVWIAIIALSVLLAVAIYFVTKLEWFEGDTDWNKQENSISDAGMIVVGAVCQQGAPVLPRTISGRILILFLFVSLMFLYTSYSANILALLQSSSTSIQTLSDLLKSRLQVGVDDTIFNHFYFPNASEPIRKALYEKKVAPPGQKARYFQIDDGVRRMRKGLFAFHMETGAGYKIVGETFLEDEKCDLEEIQFLQVPDPWLAIRKNSSYKEMLKIGLHILHESGIQNREVSLLYTKKPICTARGSSYITVSLIDCYPALTVLAGGVILSILLLIAESAIYYRRMIRINLFAKLYKF